MSFVFMVWLFFQQTVEGQQTHFTYAIKKCINSGISKHSNFSYTENMNPFNGTSVLIVLLLCQRYLSKMVVPLAIFSRKDLRMLKYLCDSY